MRLCTLEISSTYPSLEAVPCSKLAEGIKSLADNGIKFYFTLGEHDISGITGTPSSYIFHNSVLRPTWVMASRSIKAT